LAIPGAIKQALNQTGCAMAVEDPRTFHAALPELNIPGEAFGVLHGRLPGTELTGRLLCCAERPMSLPDEVRELVHDRGGPVGCDVAVVAVDAGAAPTAQLAADVASVAENRRRDGGPQPGGAEGAARC